MLRTNKVSFHVGKSYELKEKLGEGAYGVVCSAVHRPTGTLVAIKKIEPLQKPLVCLRTIREIRLLNHFKTHENIVSFITVHPPPAFDSFMEVYLVQEYMPLDLHKTIHTHDLLDIHVKYIVYQMLRGLKAIHSANVIHRDLKPSNILVNKECEVKICDFGLARIDTASGIGGLPLESNLTEYVATRWYRAPEIMLLLTRYSTAVDLWSVGCILAEMFINCPLFPGKDYRHQLLLIFQYLGTPMGEDLRSVGLTRARSYIGLLPVFDPVDVPSFFNNHYRRIRKYGPQPVSPCGLDLMTRLLSFDPARRLTAVEALEHPYVAEYHDILDEPEAELVLLPESYDVLGRDKLSMRALKKQLYSQILKVIT